MYKLRKNLIILYYNFNLYSNKYNSKVDTKVKPLNWNKINLFPKEAPNRPILIWDNIKDATIDINEVASLFEQKSSAPVVVATSVKPVNAKKRFLNDKRAQSVGITLANIPIISKVQEALETMNPTILSRSQIDSVFREFVTKEELSENESNNEPGSQWD